MKRHQSPITLDQFREGLIDLYEFRVGRTHERPLTGVQRVALEALPAWLWPDRGPYSGGPVPQADADLGVNLITLPLETMGELTMQAISFIVDVLEIKAGVWAWQGTPICFFEQYILPFVDIIEYESRAIFWERESGKSPHTMDPLMVDNIRRMHDMVAAAGLEGQIEIMEDGGLNAGNVADFIAAGMTVGEFSSPLLKGPAGKFQPGTGQIEAAVKKLRAVMVEASNRYRAENGLKK